MKYFYTLLALLSLNFFNVNAQKYWVGGSGDLRDSSHWSVSSGGAGGTDLPSLTDEIIFDENSFSSESELTITRDVQVSKLTWSVNQPFNVNFSGDGVINLYDFEINNESNFSNNYGYLNIQPSLIKAAHYSISASATDVTCFGLCDGTITVSIASGTPNYPVTLRLYIPAEVGGGTQTTLPLNATDFPYTFSGLCGAVSNYSIRAQDQVSGSAGRSWASANIDAPGEMIVADEAVSSPSCNGSGDGSIEIIFIQNAIYPVSYNWSNGAGDTDLNENLNGGLYEVTVTDDNGCEATFNWTLVEPAAIVIDDSTYTPFICAGVGGGSIDVDASGGTAPLTYSINGGYPDNSDGNFTGLAAGSYNVTVTDDNGCTKESGTYVLQANASINISDVSTDVNCNGGSDGTIDLTVSGGTAPYQFDWDNDGVGDNDDPEDLSGLSAGIYNVTVTDAVLCTGTYSVTISEPALALGLSETHVDVLCNGGNTGSIDLTVVGGTLPMSFDWDNDGVGDNDDTEDLNSLSAGTYNVTVTDNNGCTETLGPITISEPALALGLSETHVDVLCNGGNTGSIDLTVVGGTLPMSFDWDNDGVGDNDDTEDLNSLSAGTYNVTVTDNNGCTETLGPITISEPALALGLSETHVDVLCNGGNTGSIDLTVVGGTLPMSFDWDNDGVGDNDDTEDLNSLSAGTYNVTVTDNNGCTETLGPITISEPALALGLSETHVDVLCNGGNTGSIDLTVVGGTLPMSFDWDNDGVGDNDDTEDLNSLSAGTYNVTVTDNNGCTETLGPITISEPALALGLSETHVDVLCNGGNTGSIDLTVVGGTLPMSFDWDNDGVGDNDDTEDLNSLSAGTYNVTVTDNNGCTETLGPITISEPALALGLSETHVDVLCNGGNTGSIDLTVVGGTLPMSFDWDNDGVGDNDDTEDLNSLSAGTYNVTVTDNNGCTETLGPITISEPALALGLSETHVDVLCNGGNTGSIDLTVVGGTLPMSFDWDNDGVGDNDDTEDLNSLSAGTYNVTVTDNNGCTETLGPITISEPALALGLSETHVDVLCNGGNTGSIDLTVVGGTLPMSFDWDNDGVGDNDDTEDLNSLSAGTYNVTVTDNNGCTETLGPITISEPALALGLSETHVDVLCNGGNTGSIDLTVVGGTLPMSFDWDNDGVGDNDDTEDLNSLSAGTYNVTVTDNNGCTETLGPITISEPALALGLSETHVDVLCNGGNTGSIDLTVVGGTLPMSFDWDNDGVGDNDDTEDLNSLSAGTYNVTVTDNNGCTETLGPITISEPALALGLSETHVDVLCNGGNTGSIDLTVVGGTLPMSFDWDNDGVGDNDDTEDLNSLSAGTYNVTVTDNNGCTETLGPITISEPALALGLSETHVDVLCNGGNTGSIDLTVVGGTLPMSFDWDNDGVGDNDDTEDLNSLSAGTYNVTVTDNNGCTETLGPITISQPATAVVITDVDTSHSCGSYSTVIAGTTFLPDGTGVSYSTSLTHTDFAVGQTINNASDIASICLNMEHSYLGDLQLVIECPNGQTAILKQYPGGGGTFLGEPVDVNSSSTPGNGYDYCFTATPTYGTMVAEAGNYFQTYTDNDGVTYNNHPYLPEGSYQPYQNFTNLVGCPINGDWTIHVTDNLGIDDGYIFSWLLNFDPSVNPTGYCNGSIDITVLGGNPAYTYFWSNGETTEDITDLCAGEYCVTVEDQDGCQDIQCYDIIDINLSATTTTTDAACTAVCDGSATINPIGGFAPYTYQWDANAGNQTTQTATNLCPGTYYFTVTEANNSCEYVDSVTIGSGAEVLVNFTIDQPLLCNGDANGEITATPSNGLAPYDFVWDSGQSQNDALSHTITGLTAGTYEVTVTDDRGCFVVKDTTLSEPDAILIATDNLTDPLNCFGDTNGEISITVSGGTPNPNYTFNWQSPDGTGLVVTDEDQTGLSAGTYNVTVTDDNGCTQTDSWTITEPTEILIFDNTSDASCFGVCDGSVSLIVNGGIPPYDFVWSSGEIATDVLLHSITNKCAGTYDVTVTDANGCTQIGSYTIGEPADIVTDLNIDQALLCYGDNDAQITATPSNGTPPYDFAWNSGQTLNDAMSHTISGLSAGNYEVIVTDDNGCKDTADVDIIQPTEIQITVNAHTNVTCFGGNDGVIDITTSGGTPNYTFSWQTLDGSGLVPVDESQTGLSSGTYDLTITDANGCTKDTSFIITEPLEITGVITQNLQNICNGDCNASVSVAVTNGAAPYTYNWDGVVSNIDTVGNLCAGQHWVIIQDVGGCLSDTVFYNIAEPTAIQIDNTVVTDVTCNNGTDGRIQLTVSGGTPNYTFDDGTTTNNDGDFQSLLAGTYSITITDDNGCFIVSPDIIVDDGDSLFVDFTNISQAICPTTCIDTATATAGGGTGDYNYAWVTGTNGQTAMDLCKGYNLITVTDNVTGCFVVDSVLILDSSNLVVTVDTIIHPHCYGDSNGEIQITITNGTIPYTYDWTGPNGFTSNSEDLSGLESGNYFLTANDAGGNCDYTAVYTLVDPDSLFANLNITNALDCFGDCDGEISATNEQGGTTPYNYEWSSGSNLTFANNLCAGYTTLTLTDAHNCTFVDSLELIAPTELSSNITIGDILTCFGDCNASATAQGIDGTAPYSYEWGSGTLVAFESNMCAGWHYVTITDANLCTKVDSIFISEPDELILNATVNNSVLCNGDCSGSATVLASGGTSDTLNYIYEWPGGETGAHLIQIDTLCVGFHTVTVTDEVGCFNTVTFEIEDISDLAITKVDSTAISCYGECDGTFEVFANNGTPPYSFEWSNGDIGVMADTLCDQVYYVTVTDANFCTDIDSVHLIQPDSLHINFEIYDITCNGDADGEITAHVTGGTMPNYTMPGAFQWSGGTQTNDSLIVDLSQGYYTLTFTDDNSCQKIDSAQIIEPAAIDVFVVDSVMNECFSDCSGEVMVAAVGGTVFGEYGFTWNDPLTTLNDTVTDLCNGNYKVIAEDDNGCKDSLFIDIVSPTEIQINFTVQNAACNGGTDGRAEANVTGGIGPYTYTWQSGGTVFQDSIYQDLSSGWYYLTVEDVNNCIKEDSVLIQDNSNMIINVVDSAMVLCYGSCTGFYDVEVIGGTAPYDYLWSNIPADTDTMAEDLCAGVYQLSVTDDNSCLKVQSFEVTQPDSISITFDSTNVACFGGNTGEAIAHVTGGTASSGYTYSWTPVGFDNSIDSIYTDLVAGWYIVEVSDDNSCIKIDSVQIIEPVQMNLTFNPDPVNLLCYSDTGISTVTVIGGTPNYTYLWESGETTDMADSLLVGWNSVTVTDANLCEFVDSVEVIAPPQLVIDSINIVPTACGSVCDGEALAYVSGGTTAYTYTWSSGTVTDSLVVDLCFGAISLIVEDANGCQVSGNSFVPDDSDLEVNVVDSMMIHCAGDSTGQALAVVTLGTGTVPYEITWSNGDMVVGNDSLWADTLLPGIYYVTVEDADQCTAIDSVEILEEDVLAVDPITGSESCGEEGYGTIDLQTYGGIPPYAFEWAEVPDVTEYIDTLDNGTYHYTVTDDASCQIIDSIALVAPLALDVQIDSILHVLCYGDSTGYAIADVTGGTPPYIYTWSNGDTDSIADTLLAGTYYLTVEDQSTCIGYDTIVINEPPELLLTLLDTTRTECALCIGEAIVEASGGASVGANHYTLDWGTNVGPQIITLPVDTAKDLCAGFYNVVLSDSNMCTTNLLIEIEDNSDLTLAITDTVNIQCYNECTGELTAESSNGTGVHTIEWFYINDLLTPQGDNGGGNTYQITDLCADTVIIQVTDEVGCIESEMIDMIQPDSLYLDLLISAMSCYGDSSGVIIAEGHGGTPVYDYVWDDNSINDTLSNLLAGTYKITLTDANGCFVEDSADILSSPAILDTIIQTSISLCSYDPDNALDLQVSGGVSPFTYIWSNDSITEDLLGIPGGNYVVTITDDAGCHKLDSIMIEPSIVFDFDIGDDTTICYGDTIQLFTIANHPQWNTNFYQWLSSDYISDTLAQNPLVYPDSSTTFYLTVDSICKDTASINVNLFDTIGIYAGPDEEILKDQTVQLEASLHDSIVNYLWSPATGLSSDTIYNPVAKPKETVIYLLKVENVYGCFEYDTLVVNVIPEIIFPSGITPNGDGVNDVWKIDFVEKFPDIEVEIFNRWGKLLFYSKGYPDSERWDGTYKGKDLPVGTYYFVVQLNDGVHKEPITGPLTIVR